MKILRTAALGAIAFVLETAGFALVVLWACASALQQSDPFALSPSNTTGCLTIAVCAGVVTAGAHACCLSTSARGRRHYAIPAIALPGCAAFVYVATAASAAC